MNAKGVLWIALGAVFSLVTLVLVIVLPSADDPCADTPVISPSQTVAPDNAVDRQAASASPSRAATVTATPSLAAGALSDRRVTPLAEGSFTITDPFGARGGTHQGVDFAAASGTPIDAVSDGVVVAAGPASGFGNWIVVDSVDHGNGRGYSVVYGHMWPDGVLVKTGDVVKAGQRIATVGSAGQSSGPHLHLEIVPGGRLTGGRPIDPLPWLAGAPTPDSGGAHPYSIDPQCALGFGTPGGGLVAGKVPPELEQWYRKAGSLCPQISASLLAAQGQQESGFRPGASSPAGARGLAQFLPGTANALAPDGRPFVIDADGNGVASVLDPGDAIIGQGRYMCALAQQISSWIGEGRVQGDVTALTLAAYNAGAGAVLASGGMPNQAAAHFSETLPYVANILALEPQYRSAGSGGRFTPGEGAGGDRIVRAAQDWLGTPYVWGGGGIQGPSRGGFDSPGLTASAVFAASSGSVSLPDTAEQQWESGREIRLRDMAPGDLVFSDFGVRGPAEVGIYQGNGRMIRAAPSTSGNSGGVAAAPVPGDARVRRVL